MKLTKKNEQRIRDIVREVIKNPYPLMCNKTIAYLDNPEKETPKEGEYWFINEKLFKIDSVKMQGEIEVINYYNIDGSFRAFGIGDIFTHKATKEEIDQEFDKIAESKGFKEGVMFSCLTCGKVVEVRGSLGYDEHEDRLLDNYGSGYTLYQNGKWAEIIPSIKKMTIEQIENELGYSIEIVK